MIDALNETLRLSVSATIEQNGETFNFDAMPSGRNSISYTLFAAMMSSLNLFFRFNFKNTGVIAE